MNKPKLEITYARLDVPNSNTAPDKHNTDDRIHVGVTTGVVKERKSVKKEIYVFYHPQFECEIYAGDTLEEAQEMWSIESDSYKDSTDELGKIRKVVADVSQLKEI